MSTIKKVTRLVWPQSRLLIIAGKTSESLSYLTDFLAKKQGSSGFFQASVLKTQGVLS